MKNFLKKIFTFLLFPPFLLFLFSGSMISESNLELEKRETSEIVSPDSLLQKQFDRAVDFLRKGEFDYSIQSFENAILTINQGGLVDKNLVYRTYVNFGVLLNRVGDWKKSLNFYDIAESFTITEFGDDSNKLIPIYGNKGTIFNNYGDLVKAQNYYEKALSLLEVEGNPKWLSQTYNNLGVILYKKANYSESLKYYLRTLNLKKESNSQNFSSTFNNIANCYKKLKRYDEADLYYKMSIEEIIKTNGTDYYLLGDYYLNYAVFQNEIKNYDNVLPYLNLAFDIYLKNFGNKHPDTAHCLKNFGDYYSKRNDHLNALQYYQKALIAEVDNFNNSTVYINPTMNELDPQLSILEILKPKANTLHELYSKTNSISDLDFSLQTYDLCLDIIDKIRIAYQDEESKFALSKNEKETYNQAIEIAVKLYQLTKDVKYKEKAFIYSERSKSASLQSSLNDVNAKNFGGISTELQEKETNLKLNIAKYRELVHDERKKQTPDRDSISGWQNVLFNLNEEYNQMVLRFEEDYPEYYALKYDTKTIDIEELQSRLSDNDLLIEYSISDSALFSFVITKSSFEVEREKIVKDSFDYHLEEVRNCLKTNDFANNSVAYYQKYTKSAYLLYQHLLNGKDSLLTGKSLLIVPDDKMAYIPFGVLLKKEADTTTMNYRNLEYLIKYNSITYHNSATLGFKNHSSSYGFSSNKSILAFAPSYNDVNDSILYTERAYRDKLYPLPGVKEEVINISKVIHGDLFIDDMATEANFKANSGEYDVLHLAMHTIIDDENPMYSKLVFTQNSDSLQDGLLNTHEIYNMNFNARMVVLSACNTGDGKLFKGEGVMSLARGFFYAGCPSVIMTLWTVEDKTGSNLMSNFYTFLSHGLKKDDALRQAKLEYLKTADALKSHPYFWSGYVTLGDVDPLYDDGLIHKLMYFAFGSVGIILFLFFRKKFKGKAVA
ncbi:CHAT domain-containing tetratricopeptide repeat protein [Labilibaculum manganireducens]|uniref:CHAT domain-containing protein n=1 Tax=Labilibaculum manganireducens TaxID=1940525 RepID=UPI0029F5178F|nr:CHAT domain-containing tetratricopeptide repeat protein [Labilibaculum manganireducens]